MTETPNPCDVLEELGVEVDQETRDKVEAEVEPTPEDLEKIQELNQRLAVCLGRAAAIVDTEIRVGLSKEKVKKDTGEFNRKQRRRLASRKRKLGLE